MLIFQRNRSKHQNMQRSPTRLKKFKRLKWLKRLGRQDYNLKLKRSFKP